MVPSVRVTYEAKSYYHPHLVELVLRQNSEKGNEKVNWERVKGPIKVACWSWRIGFHLDLPFRRTWESPIAIS